MPLLTPAEKVTNEFAIQAKSSEFVRHVKRNMPSTLLARISLVDGETAMVELPAVSIGKSCLVALVRRVGVPVFLGIEHHRVAK